MDELKILKTSAPKVSSIGAADRAVILWAVVLDHM